MKTSIDLPFFWKRYGKTLNRQWILEEIIRRDLVHSWVWFYESILAIPMLPEFLSHDLKNLNCFFQKSALLARKKEINQESVRKACNKISAYLTRTPPEASPQELFFSLSLKKEMMWERKWALIFRTLFPPPYYLKQKMGLKGEKTNRVYLYYPLHLFGFFHRGFKKIWPRRFFSLIRKPKGFWRVFLVIKTLFSLSLYQRFLGLKAMLKRLTPGAQDLPYSPKEVFPKLSSENQNLVDLAEWFLGLDVFFFRPTCLKRSLLFYTLFQREGIPVVFHLGIRKKNALQDAEISWQQLELEGHSWLTLEDRIFLEPEVSSFETFTETFCYPQSNPHTFRA